VLVVIVIAIFFKRNSIGLVWVVIHRRRRYSLCNKFVTVYRKVMKKKMIIVY